jgi:hypothetical protein
MATQAHVLRELKYYKLIKMAEERKGSGLERRHLTLRATKNGAKQRNHRISHYTYNHGPNKAMQTNLHKLNQIHSFKIGTP